MKNRKQKINLIKNRIIINILGEICWGMEVKNFEKKIKVEKNIVEKLLNFLLENEKSNVEYIDLTEDEIAIIKKSFVVLLSEMDDWEFPIRIGVSIEEAEEILKQFF